MAIKARPVSDLDGIDADLAGRYRIALTDLHAWVRKEAKAGNSDLFGEPLSEQMRKIENQLGVDDEVWSYIDWDSLYFEVMG